MKTRDYKKRYAICKDSKGKTIYAGDTVELSMPLEVRSKWESQVWWNMLDGAFVDSHPAHKRMGSVHRDLSCFLTNEKLTCRNEYGEIVDITPSVFKVKSFCK